MKKQCINKIKCKYFDRGFCRLKENCRFRHPKTTCRKVYNEDGKCYKGFSCLNIHPRKECKFWQEFKCKKDDKCTFRHSARKTTPNEKYMEKENGIPFLGKPLKGILKNRIQINQIEQKQQLYRHQNQFPIAQSFPQLPSITRYFPQMPNFADSAQNYQRIPQSNMMNM